MKFVVLGFNHKVAPVAIRETMTFTKESLAEGLTHIYGSPLILEGVLLSTCNRTELYGVIEDNDEGAPLLGSLFQELVPEPIDDSFYYYYEGVEAITHLFRVASSLDSLVVGEGQILSQLKHAYYLANKGGTTGTLTNIIFHKAIAIGKKVRSQTAISDKPVSVCYTAVLLSEKYFDPLRDAKVLLLGSGTMSRLTGTHLASRGVHSIIVSNRTFGKAKELAQEINGEAVPFDDFMTVAQEAQIIFTSTGAPHYIMSYDEAVALMKKRNGKPLVIMDIAVPRDIDPDVASIEGVQLFNIDDLEKAIEKNLEERQKEAELAQPIIEEGVQEVVEKLTYLPVRPMMVLISDKAERIRRREVHRLLVKMPHVSEEEKRLIHAMSRQLVRKLLRDPMIHFNEVASQNVDEGPYWDILNEMFNLEGTENNEH